jgi:DNA-binding GntR family transcriptional regulator
VSNESQSDATQAERAARILERAIVTGDLLPRARLGVHELSARYDIGITPIREGLSRLTDRGFVVAMGKKGFRVADASEADLRDIIVARMSLEIDALRLSILQGDDHWEGEILAALHRMKRFTERHAGGPTEGDDTFDEAHKDFHMAMIGACRSARMLEFCNLLFDQAYRYRRLMFAATPHRREDVDAEHENMAMLALDRDGEAACVKYAQHLNRTLLSLYPTAAPVPLSRPLKTNSPVPPS